MRGVTKQVPELIRRFAARYSLLVLLDGLAVLASYGLALLLRFEWKVPPFFLEQFLDTVWVLIMAYWAMNVAWGLYGQLWQYASAQEVTNILGSAIFTTAGIFFVDLLWPAPSRFPLSVVLMGGILTTGAFTLVRYRQRLFISALSRLEEVVGSPDRRRVIIVGAGEAGQLLALQLQHPDHRRKFELVGFADDDQRKQGLRSHGLAVLGRREEIPRLTRQRRVDTIIIAIHRISGPDFREILSICQQTTAQVKVLPDVLALFEQPIIRPNGAGSFLPIRDVEPRDLLGRREITVDEEACRVLIRDKVVLVTGACGSIGSELCHQIIRFRPSKLLMVDNNETGLYDMQPNLKGSIGDRVVCVIADVTDKDKMEAIIANERPQIIFHAAAYKHVPLMEAHPEEAVRVNVGGTRLLCRLAQHYRVERFVLISTDKAVHPSSVMGLSKRIGELLILGMDPSSDSRFTAVRFGNVLGSRGSVVLTFARQIAEGGPVTVTDERMSRYFMTPLEAVSLIIQAATLTRGSDIFLLDMGQEIKIVDLAQRMVQLQGWRPGSDIQIVCTGARPGEKLREELYYDGVEKREPTVYPGIYRLTTHNQGVIEDTRASIFTGSPPADILQVKVDHLLRMARTCQKDEIADQMGQIVSTFDRSLSIPMPDQTPMLEPG